MVQDDQNTPGLDEGFDPSIQSEKIAFDKHQLLECSSCGRRNPPNRLGCLYCGSMLDLDGVDGAIKPGVRRPDTWESGVTVVSAPVPTGIVGADVFAASRFLSLELSELETILRAGIPMPLIRVDGEAQATSVQKILAGFGIESTIVSDQSLRADKLPVRLGGITFLDSGLSFVTFNSREAINIPYSDIALIVEGVIAISKVDQLEKRKRGGVSRPQGEVSTISDEPILDIYSSKDDVGFRVMTSGFDFSSVAANKSLVAAENLKELIRRLSEACTNARSIAEFRSLRAVIGRVWEVEERRDTKGLHVTGFGKRAFGSVLSTNNLDQFTKFSRLQRLLL